jgi:endo-1,3(4)-beta-glucanase
MLNNQTSTVWTFPYSLRWSAGQDNIGSWGIAISHVEASQFVYGPGDPASYYVTPVAVDSMILSAAEFSSSTALTTDTHQAFSANVNLAPSTAEEPLLTLPLVQGMGFITGIYTAATPLIQSGVLFEELSPLTQVGSAWKCSVTLQDGFEWLIYLIPSSGSQAIPNVTLTSSSTITGPDNFTGIIQIAKLSGGSVGEAAYDGSAGVYAINCTVTASLGVELSSVNGTTMSDYSLSWTKAGDISKTLIMFALPHHIQAFTSSTTNASISNTTLQTTTKGIATAVLADMWIMEETLPTE